MNHQGNTRSLSVVTRWVLVPVAAVAGIVAAISSGIGMKLGLERICQHLGAGSDMATCGPDLFVCEAAWYPAGLALIIALFLATLATLSVICPTLIAPTHRKAVAITLILVTGAVFVAIYLDGG